MLSLDQYCVANQLAMSSIFCSITGWGCNNVLVSRQKKLKQQCFQHKAERQECCIRAYNLHLSTKAFDALADGNEPEATAPITFMSTSIHLIFQTVSQQLNTLTSRNGLAIMLQQRHDIGCRQVVGFRKACLLLLLLAC